MGDSGKGGCLTCLGFLAFFVFGSAALFTGVWAYQVRPWDDQGTVSERTEQVVIRHSSRPGTPLDSVLLAYQWDGRVYLAGADSVGRDFLTLEPVDDVCVDPDNPTRHETVAHDDPRACSEIDQGRWTGRAERFVPRGTARVKVESSLVDPVTRRTADGRERGHRLTVSYVHHDVSVRGNEQEYADQVWLPRTDWRPGEPLAACVDPDEPAVYVLMVDGITECTDEQVGRRGAADLAETQRPPDWRPEWEE